MRKAGHRQGYIGLLEAPHNTLQEGPSPMPHMPGRLPPSLLGPPRPPAPTCAAVLPSSAARYSGSASAALAPCCASSTAARAARAQAVCGFLSPRD